VNDRAPRQRAIDYGRRCFGSTWFPASVAEAPGRLELIGNHVDYNCGLVLAGAIDRVVAVVAGQSSDRNRIEIAAADVSGDIAEIDVEACRHWRHNCGDVGPDHYVRGVLAALMERGHPVQGGFQVAIAGDVPLGFGMSSSAALCVALVMTLSAGELDPHEIVAVAREAEHRCGNPVGAMDQSASIAGGIILFDGRDDSFTSREPRLDDYVFAVADSGVAHALGASSYAVRVAESREALATIRSCLLPDLPSLGELTPDVWANARSMLADRIEPVQRSRVDHVVSEVDRVRRGVDAIQVSDWIDFGRLMTESGRSSNENYKISHPMVEALVAEMLAIDGVAGARMMGGGEGGPALTLIHRDAVESVGALLDHGYFRNHPSHMSGNRLQVCAFGAGARIESLSQSSG